MEVAGEILEVARDPMGLAQLARLRDGPRKVPQSGQEGSLGVMSEQRRVEPVGEMHAILTGQSGDVAGPGVGVLHVEDGVLVGVLGQQVQINVDHRVRRGPGECIARGVDSHGLDEILQHHDGPRSLAHPHRFAVLDQVDHLADQDLEVLVRGVAESRAHGHHPPDVAVMVGAEQDESPVEAALALVQVVGEVTGDVCRFAVGLDDHAILVVPVVGGPQPFGATLLIHRAQLGQPGDGTVDGAGLVQVVLVEVDVERDAKVMQRRLYLGEHQVDAQRAEPFQSLRVGQVENARVSRHHGSSDVVDVGAGIAILGGRITFGSSQQRRRETIDLGSMVVEVVLAGHLGARELEDARQCITDGCPSGAPEVDRAGRVGRDELHVDPVASLRVAATIGRPCLDNRPRELPGRRGVQRDVEESRPCDVNRLDADHRTQACGEGRGNLAGRHTGTLGNLQGEVRRPVAVIAIPGPLDAHLVGHVHGKLTGSDGVDEGGADREDEQFRGHPHDSRGALVVDPDPSHHGLPG